MIRNRTAVLLLVVLLAPLAGASEIADKVHQVPQREELAYDWRLGGFVGAMAGLFLPNKGTGVMSVEPAGDDMLKTELLITSPEAKADEYWRYGSRITAQGGYAREAWNSYQWRDKEEHERAEVEEPRVRDIVAGIYQIRRELPEEPQQMRIWSDGKIYPVVVIPKGVDTVKVNGERVRTLRFSVRGYRAPGQRLWKGSLELWLARDSAATPVRMHIERSLANLRLHLRDLP